jgi:GT2 family glycosyltransferase
VPALSVIIPTYNMAAFVPQAINSVLAQTYRDHEIIVVDDGSTDETPQVLASLASDIRVIRQENQGVSIARNRGFIASHGDWVAFLDADDRWRPEFEAHMLAVAADADPGLGAICCGWEYLDAEGTPIGTPRCVTEEAVELDALLRRNAFPLHAAVVRRQCFAQAGMFNPKLRALEDWDFWLRFVQRGFRIRCVEAVLASYRQVPASRSRDLHAVRESGVRVLDRFFASPGLEPQIAALEQIARGLLGLTNAADLFRANRQLEGLEAFIDTLVQHKALLGLPDTYYEIICAEQPRALAGAVWPLDLNCAQARLGAILGSLTGLSKSTLRRAHKLGFRVLGEFAYRQGNTRLAIRYALRSIGMSDRPRSVPSSWRLLLKSALGLRTVHRARSIMGAR